MAIVQKNYIPTLSERLESGGLAQIVSLKGGSRTWFALSCLGNFLNTHTGDPPLSLWLSNEGDLYPEAIQQYWEIPLSRMLLIRAPNAEEVWRTALDAVQTGLFAWMFLKTERSGQGAQMRKLQLAAEKTKTRILILCQARIPHWNLKASIQVTPELADPHAHPLLKK